jgi:hypothetical protein
MMALWRLTRRENKEDSCKGSWSNAVQRTEISKSYKGNDNELLSKGVVCFQRIQDELLFKKRRKACHKKVIMMNSCQKVSDVSAPSNCILRWDQDIY